MTGDVFARARAWVAGDVDPGDQAALTALIDANDHTAVQELMGTGLTFGTAGLRAEMAPGANRMNRATVIRTTYAVAQWLHERTDGTPTVVVGWDARHRSDTFATDVVAVFLAYGVDVWRFDTPVPTPLVAFAQHHLGCDAAVVITASHNPAQDNGYKLYGDGAAQIVSPDDETIQQLMRDAPAANAIRIHADLSDAQVVTRAVFDAYQTMVTGLHTRHDAPRPAIVYTPLHGVGAHTFLQVAAACGYDDVTVVAAQRDPDPEFSTVPFPNPEEPGALDLALQLAEETYADLVIANDPDADRLAIAIPEANGRFRALSGNEIGVLLTDYLLEHTTAVKPLVVTTVVSTPMVDAVAARHGAHVERTFTGFKWIARAAAGLTGDGFTFVYGFEEALGSNVTTDVHDKDGISAAIVFADLTMWLTSRGETVAERLATLGVIDGVWVSQQVSVTRPGHSGSVEIRDAMARLKASPPVTVAGRRVIQVNDYTAGGVTRPSWRKEDLLIELVFTDGRVLVRPSGTEPKIKAYADLSFAVTSAADVPSVRERGATEARALAQAVLADIGVV